MVTRALEDFAEYVLVHGPSTEGLENLGGGPAYVQVEPERQSQVEVARIWVGKT
jgi:hypothetical protein